MKNLGPPTKGVGPGVNFRCTASVKYGSAAPVPIKLNGDPADLDALWAREFSSSLGNRFGPVGFNAKRAMFPGSKCPANRERKPA